MRFKIKLKILTRSAQLVWPILSLCFFSFIFQGVRILTSALMQGHYSGPTPNCGVMIIKMSLLARIL